MKKVIGALAIWGITLTSPAENLVTNGNFETGDFSGWVTMEANIVTDSAALSGTFSAQVGNEFGPGFLQQTITTIPGEFYSIRLNKGQGSYSLQVTGSDENSVLAYTYMDRGAGQYGSGFVADGISATVSIGDSWNNEVIQSTFDNIVVQKAAFSKPGKYTGTITTTRSFSGFSLSSVNKLPVTARIDASGQMVGFFRDGSTFTGIISDDGVITKDLVSSFSVNAARGTVNYSTYYSFPEGLFGSSILLNTEQTVVLRYSGK